MPQLAAGFALIAAMPVSAQRAPTPDLPDGCAGIEQVEGLGRVCPVPGGYMVPLPSGWLFTHGGDAVDDRYSEFAGSRPSRPSCVTKPTVQFHARVLYARAQGTPDRFGTRYREIVAMVNRANGWLEAEARRHGRSVKLRVLCAGNSVAVKKAVLPTPFEQTTFGSVTNDLYNMGYTSPLAKYWIWFDGQPPGAPGGTGTMWTDDSSGAGNRNNVGLSYAVTWGFRGAAGAGIMMHENGHNMGAVQVSAPHTTGAGHCTDGLDVMCYADGGVVAARYRTSVCAQTRYDCGNDDYFNPRPRRGSYIAGHWNIGSPVNRFVAGCSYSTGTLRSGLAGADPEAVLEQAAAEVPDEVRPEPTGILSRAHAIPRSCRGRPFAASAMVLPPSSLADGPGPYDEAETVAFILGPDPIRDVDVDVCWYARSTHLRCDARLGLERGTVPSKATHARVVLRGSAPSVYVLNVI